MWVEKGKSLPSLRSSNYAVAHSMHVWMWELDCEESWTLKNWCSWTAVLEKTPASSLDCKEIQPVHSKGDQPWVFLGRNDAKAETPVLWPPQAKSWLIGKDSDAGRDRGQEEKGMTEDEMAGWHHRLDRREFEWTPGVGDGQGGLARCDSWGREESDTTEWLNWTELMHVKFLHILHSHLGLNDTSPEKLSHFHHFRYGPPMLPFTVPIIMKIKQSKLTVGWMYIYPQLDCDCLTHCLYAQHVKKKKRGAEGECVGKQHI